MRILIVPIQIRLKHKQAENSVCEWRDNKVSWIPPEKILIHNK